MRSKTPDSVLGQTSVHERTVNSLLDCGQKALTYTLDKQACTSVRTTFHNEKARQEVIKTNESHESLLVFTNPNAKTTLIQLILTCLD